MSATISQYYGEACAYVETLPARADLPFPRVLELSGSRRFVPIGRTGYWALREWQDVETHAIPGMTAELLNLPRHLYTTSQ